MRGKTPWPPGDHRWAGDSGSRYLVLLWIHSATPSADWIFDILVARSTDDGATWTAPAPLNTNAASDACEYNDEDQLVRCDDDERPQLTTDGAGTWVAVWEYWGPCVRRACEVDRDIRVSRSTDGGATWSPPATLNSNAVGDWGDDKVPQLTTDGQGNWVAVWQSRDPLGNTIGQDLDILFARSTDDGATWTDAAALNTSATSDPGRNDAEPQLTTDGQGTWVAVWQSGYSLDGTIGSDPDILFARSTDGGATWTDPAALNTNAASDTDYDEDLLPQLTVDGQGNWMAVWQSGNPF